VSTKSQLLFWHSVIKPFIHSFIDSFIQTLNKLKVAKRSDFWHSDLRDNCESAYDYVFHLTCVMPIPGKTLLFGDKQNSQTVKPQIENFLIR